jgi:hypothetical protein
VQSNNKGRAEEFYGRILRFLRRGARGASLSLGLKGPGDNRRCTQTLRDENGWFQRPDQN